MELRVRAAGGEEILQVGSDAAANPDDLRLLEELRKAGGDLETSLLVYRRHRLACEARLRIPDCAGLPQFVSCTNWDHQFPETDREVKVRWAFDRRVWSVVVLHVLQARGAWRNARPDEVLDVTESLVLANPQALYDVRDWGCKDGNALPSWAAAPARD